MTDGPAQPVRRLGILSDPLNPVAQLLEDLYADQAVEFVTITDPAVDAADLDEIVVLSQAHALTHIRALIESERPCRILLRRQGALANASNWRTGTEWLAAILKSVDWPQLRLVALTEAAAEELAVTVGLPVAAIGELAALPGARSKVRVSRKSEVIEFSGTAIDGVDDVRRAELDLFNWARLRRLADLWPEDPDDPDMADLTAFARGASPAASVPAVARGSNCILTVVPNGIGLGHITRMMAVAKSLKEQGNTRVIFWSFSRAAEILQGAGLEVILRQNFIHLGAHPPDWRRWETLEFASAIRHFAPSALTYDGGNFDMFMIDALRLPGCGRCGVVWVRRGMLHPDSDAQVLEAEQYCDVVLEPGDLAVEMDMGPTKTRKAQHRGFSRLVVAPPVTLKPYLEPYERRVARRRLGLRRGRHCLVSLGGNFGNWDRLRNQIVELARAHRVKLIWAQSPLAGSASEALGDAQVRQFYPLSRFLSAFDGVITATGYNSFHELMLGYDKPVLLAPTNFGRLDDQVARATHAGRHGWASVIYADDPADQSPVIADFMKRVSRGETWAARPPEVQGAPVMAKEILSVCRRYN